MRNRLKCVYKQAELPQIRGHEGTAGKQQQKQQDYIIYPQVTIWFAAANRRRLCKQANKVSVRVCLPPRPELFPQETQPPSPSLETG